MSAKVLQFQLNLPLETENTTAIIEDLRSGYTAEQIQDIIDELDVEDQDES